MKAGRYRINRENSACGGTLKRCFSWLQQGPVRKISYARKNALESFGLRSIF